MKILAILVNLGWLVFAVIMTVKDPPRSSDVWVIILIFSTLVINLVALLWRGGAHNWLSLLLQRKALEEKKKMEALSAKDRD